MENHQPETTGPIAPPRRWPLFAAGILLFFLGPVIYALQFRAHQLETPWHAPILATAGVLFMAASAWQRRGIWRSVGLGLFVVLCGFEWFMVVIGIATPTYTGPAQPGHTIPAFATTLASGEEFTTNDLENGVPTVLLFFRGRW